MTTETIGIAYMAAGLVCMFIACVVNMANKRLLRSAEANLQEAQRLNDCVVRLARSMKEQ